MNIDTSLNGIAPFTDTNIDHRYITVHHTASVNQSAKDIVNYWHNTQAASAHYVIQSDGRVFLTVDEDLFAWHAGTGKLDGVNPNSIAIGIEVMNDSAAPDWHVSDIAIESLIELIKDIQSRRGPLTIIGHKDTGASTACPGPYLYSKLDYIRSRVSNDESPHVANEKRAKYQFTADDIKGVGGINQVRCNFLCPVGFDWIDNGIPFNYITPVGGGDGSNLYIGDHFTFDDNVIIKTPATSGTGGYLWTKIGIANDDSLDCWISAQGDIDHIIYEGGE